MIFHRRTGGRDILLKLTNSRKRAEISRRTAPFRRVADQKVPRIPALSLRRTRKLSYDRAIMYNSKRSWCAGWIKHSNLHHQSHQLKKRSILSTKEYIHVSLLKIDLAFGLSNTFDFHGSHATHGRSTSNARLAPVSFSASLKLSLPRAFSSPTTKPPSLARLRIRIRAPESRERTLAPRPTIAALPLQPRGYCSRATSYARTHTMFAVGSKGEAAASRHDTNGQNTGSRIIKVRRKPPLVSRPKARPSGGGCDGAATGWILI